MRLWSGGRVGGCEQGHFEHAIKAGHLDKLLLGHVVAREVDGPEDGDGADGGCDAAKPARAALLPENGRQCTQHAAVPHVAHAGGLHLHARLGDVER